MNNENDPTIIIGCDPADYEKAFTTAVIYGKSVQLLIVDEVPALVGEKLHQALVDLITNEKGTIDRFNIKRMDFAELERRCIELGLDQLPHIDDYGRPDKVQAEAPVPKHNIHPKAKAKLPFYHQRRRF